MSLESLKQLDERIQAFINHAEKQRKETEYLAQRVAELEKKLNEASVQIKDYESERRQHESERGEIKNRIDKLLARFEGLNFA